jgi:hypothetical protein
MDQDPHWGWARKTAANLLALGFETNRIPYDLRDLAWAVLEPVTDDPHPGPEDEPKASGYQDFANYSINTTRGEAMHAVIGYALWVRRAIDKEPDEKNRAPKGFDQAPEVREVLDKHLDPAVDPSPTIRSVYGQWFPSLHFLDPDWAKANLERVFPREQDVEELRDAAWKTYIVYCKPFDEAFRILHEQYSNAIDRIGPSPEKEGGRPAPDEHLAQHLVTQYWQGNLDLDDPNGLLSRFYAKADLKLRKPVIKFIGFAVHRTKGPIPEQIAERLRKLWTVRLEAVRAAGPDSRGAEEIKESGWWLASKGSPGTWSIDQILEVVRLAGSIEPEHLVVERLAELSQEIPAKAVETLMKMLEGDKQGWSVASWSEHARTILATALNSVDQNAHAKANDLVHYLGSRGYPEFRDLLPAN